MFGASPLATMVIVPSHRVAARSTELKNTWQNTGPAPETVISMVAWPGPVASALSTSTVGRSAGGPGGGGGSSPAGGGGVPVSDATGGGLAAGVVVVVGVTSTVTVSGAGGTVSVV